MEIGTLDAANATVSELIGPRRRVAEVERADLASSTTNEL